MLLDYIQVDDILSISYYDKNGKTQIKNLKLQPSQLFNWEYCAEGSRYADPKYRSWDGRAVRRVPTKRPTKFRLAEIIDDLPKETYDEIFEYNIPQTFFVDIETKIDKDLTVQESARQARVPVTIIGIATPDREVIVLGWEKDLDSREIKEVQKDVTNHVKTFGGDFKFTYKKFPDETSMLKNFMNKMVPKMPMLTGWNFTGFDWTFLTNRCKKLGIDFHGASPIKKLIGKEQNVPVHVGLVDYMECYSKWDTSVSQKENLKLDQAGLDVLGVQKVPYEGTLDDMYNNNFKKYVFYNAIDCALVEMLHEKLGVSIIGNTLTYIAKCPTTRMFSPVALTESIMAREFYKQNKVLVSIKMDKNQEAYEGAFVKNPIKGFHRYCTCNDFASLYPNVIRLLNLSPETLILKLNEDDEEAKQNYLKKGFIVSQSGCVFSKEPGVFSQLVGRVYNQRRAYKKTAVQAAIKSRLLEDLLNNKSLTDEEAMKEFEKIMLT